MDDSASSSDEYNQQRAKKKAPPNRRGHDITPVQSDSEDPAPRARKPSAKQAHNNKENQDAILAKIAALQKQLGKSKSSQKSARSKTAQSASAAGDDDPESEDPTVSDGEGITFVSGITPLAPVTVTRPPKTKLTRRKPKSSVASKISAYQFSLLPELTPDQLAANNSPSVSPEKLAGAGINTESPAPSSPSPLERDCGRAPTTSSKRSSPPESSVLPPPAKRVKPARKEAPFRDGFIDGPGVKPNASDYTPVPRALLLRACSGYTARILGVNPFPSVGQAGIWAKECFTEACRAAGERYILSARMVKIIVARGSHARGKLIEATRFLYASHYGFVRSTNVKTIAANKANAEKLLNGAAVHYKVPETRVGYAENTIIADVRQLKWFKKKDSVGVVFASFFDPIPLPLIALELTALEFCTKEWETGSFIQASFTEKDVSESYERHLVDTQKWSEKKKDVTTNIRRKWFRRASNPITKTAATNSGSNIDEEQEQALLEQLEGRTGETDSEAEDNDAMES